MSESSPERSQQRQLGELMTELGMITHEQLAVALEAQRESGRALGQLIVEMGFSSGAAVAHALAVQNGGALRTEYGYALGLPSGVARGTAGDERPNKRDADDVHALEIPKLRLVEVAAREPDRVASQPGAVTQEEQEPARGDAPDDARPPASVSQDREAAVESPAPSVIVDSVGASLIGEGPDPLALEVARERDAALAALQEAATARERAVSELADARNGLAEARERLAASEVTTRERDEARAEIGRLQGVLTELRTSSAEELAAASDKGDRLAATLGETQEVLDAALERLAAADSAAAERDTALAEVERLRAALDEERRQATEAAAGLAEMQEALRQALELQSAAEEVAARHSSAAAEVERLQAALAEARAEWTAGAAEAAQKHERLAAQLAETQQALAEAERRSGTVSSLEAERDEALAEVERLHAAFGKSQAQHAAEDAAAEEVRERLVLGLAETQEALRQAMERQAAAEEEASDRGRAAIELAGERDRVTQELSDAERALRETRQQLEAASRVVEAQDRARAEVDRLHAVVEHWHAWAAQAPVADQAVGRREGDPDEPSHQSASSPGSPRRDAALCERGDYVLLIPSGNGYALAPRAGSPPSAGEVIDVRDAETQDISRFTVARVGRSPLPDGGICVYLLSN